MDDEGLPRRLVEAAQPAEQRYLVGMRRQPADGVDTRSDRNRFTEDMDQPRPIDQAAACLLYTSDAADE